jgi:radical SAM enzyme (TIGR01210 family)
MAEPIADARTPALAEQVDTHLDGAAATRLMVILRAPGCRYQQRTGGCTNCGFDHLTSVEDHVTTEQYRAQLEAALRAQGDALETIAQLDLYNSGSFFEDSEVSPLARTALLALACERMPSLKRIVVESRPELISEERLDDCLSVLGPSVQLEVAIGLESIDETIREQKIKKGFSLAAFERACRRLASRSVGVLAYLLLKPIDTSEREAIADVIASGRYLSQLATTLRVPLRVALEPTFVVEGTPLHQAFLRGHYRPPSLWSVVAVVKALAPLLPLEAGLSAEGLPTDQRPAGCPCCTTQLREALAAFNRTQKLAALERLSCRCQSPASA